MPSFLDRPLHQPRRSDRAIADDAWIEAFLDRMPMMTLALLSGGHPFVNTNLFAFDAAHRTVIIHTAPFGRLIETVDAAPDGVPACLTVFEMGRLLPAERAKNFSVEYSSVVAFGTLRRLHEPEAIAIALQALMDKYAPHLMASSDYAPASDAELRTTGTFCFHIDAWSAKQKNAPDDFTGAYYYQDVQRSPTQLADPR
ncbi:MAG: pyridoxamine 5'-phosphate oxidase family protein [Bacteroidota bacterium]